MEYTITGKNMEVSEALKEAVIRRLGSLGHFFSDDTHVEAVITKDAEKEMIEVTIPTEAGIIRTEQSSSDIYVSIDLAEEVLERQLKRYRSLLKERFSQDIFSDDFLESEGEEELPIRISRTKKYPLTPMTPQEACLMMNMIGHDFFVFVHDKTGDVEVAYRRMDGTYGIMEPEKG